MYEDAQEIFDYLPIRRDVLENEYINHLWEVFVALYASEGEARGFSIMPFHLLFIMALQYKVLRIFKEKRLKYKTAFTLKFLRDHSKLLEPSSVFEIASLNERTMPDLFKLISLDGENIAKVKQLVDYRNDKLAHAKGGIEQNPEEKIQNYLEVLHKIQKRYQPLNNKIAKEWLKEIDNEIEPSEFIEASLLNTFLCPADFQKGLLVKKFPGYNSAINNF